MVLGPILGGFAVFVALMLRSAWWTRRPVDVATAAVLLITLALSARYVIVALLEDHVRIVPSFEAPLVEGSPPWRDRGVALAMHRDRLRELASQLGVASLDTFGFADPRLGDEVLWHDAAELLRSVNALATALTTDTYRSAPDDHDLRQDLVALGERLRVAHEQGVRVVLSVSESSSNNAGGKHS